MNAYSLDLRERVVAARDAGTQSLPEVAARFGVSVSFISKVLARRRGSGSIAAKPRSGGRAPAVAGRARRVLAALVRSQPDATLEELRDRLAARCGVAASVPTVFRAVARLGLPLKKSRRTPTGGTRRGSAGCAGRTPGRCGGSRGGSGCTSTRRARPPA
jgi:transposase